LLRRFLYKHILLQYKAPVFVISVGNIIVGGSGKTPFTIYLAELLSHHGLKTGVSHRGYKSQLEKKVTIISDRNGLLPASENAGDEAWLIAKRLVGIPVVVGKKREKALIHLFNNYPDLDCIILDDSFQHLKVRHDLDFIVISERIKFGNGFVLPAGIMREPLSALKNSDILILNRITGIEDTDSELKEKLDSFKKMTFSGSYNSDMVYDFDGNKVPLEEIAGDRAVMLAGIGYPAGFASSVNKLNLNITFGIPFPDHFDYKDKSVRNHILTVLKQQNSKWLITTEKDYAKLRLYPEFAENLLTLKISFKLDRDEDKIIELVTDNM